jgi:hypothetical protein
MNAQYEDAAFKTTIGIDHLSSYGFDESSGRLGLGSVEFHGASACI